MATIYGENSSDFWRTRVEYSTSETDTTFTINAKLYFHYSQQCSVNLGECTKYLEINGSKYYSSVTGSPAHVQGEKELLLSKSITYSKGTSTRSITIEGYIRRSGSNVAATNGTSYVSKTFTIPKKTLTLTYSANGGGGAPSSRKAVYGTNVAISSTRPTRSGYDFVNWNTKSDGTGSGYVYGEYKTLTANTTLYAKWRKHVSVSYSGNGGSCSIPTKTISQGTSVTIPTTKPTRTGYDFLRWNTKADGSGNSYNPGATIYPSSNVTLYAQWHLSYVEPKISNVRAYRVAGSGTASGVNPDVLSGGTRVYFDCDYTPPQQIASSNAISKTLKLTGKNENFDAVHIISNKIYGYTDDNALGNMEKDTAELSLFVTDYKGISHTYRIATYVSSENYIFDAYKGVSGEEEYQSFAVGCAARDFGSSDRDSRGDFDVSMRLTVNNIDYSISVEEYDELMGYINET